MPHTKQNENDTNICSWGSIICINVILGCFAVIFGIGAISSFIGCNPEASSGCVFGTTMDAYVVNFTGIECKPYNQNYCLGISVELERDNMVHCTYEYEGDGTYINIGPQREQFPIGTKTRVTSFGKSSTCLIATNLEFAYNIWILGKKLLITTSVLIPIFALCYLVIIYKYRHHLQTAYKKSKQEYELNDVNSNTQMPDADTVPLINESVA